MSAVVRLIKSKTISFTEEILNHYKELSLTESEVVALIFLYRKSDDQDNILSINDLTSKMTLSENEVSSLVIGLVQKGFIEITLDEGYESFNLDGAFERLATTIEQVDKTDILRNRQDLLSQIVIYIETTYAKTLPPADLQIINNWLDLGYTFSDIKTAILDSLKAKKLHLRYADAILASRASNKNREKVEYDEDIKKMLDDMYAK